jgi:hypothetical protein
MKRAAVTILIVVLVGVNIALLLQNQQLHSQTPLDRAKDNDSIPDYLYTSYYEGEVYYTDIRGAYTYPSFGRSFLPRDEDGNLVTSPLTLAVFMSAESSCPYRTNEVAVYKRLLPIFQKRGQSIFVVVNREDSGIIADSLEVWDFDVPIVLRETNPYSAAMTFEQLGISAMNMPFKILFDSTYTAVYMRGANNSPESQEDFETAALRLSELVAEGEL